MTILLTNVKKYYKEERHQIEACKYLGRLLLKTPSRIRLGLRSELDWLECSDKELEWLQNQISNKTLYKFAELWRNKVITPSQHINELKKVKYFSQRDNYILPYVTCNSSAHSMFLDYILRYKLGKDGLTDDKEFIKRVFSGKYGTYGRNPSVSWDIQSNVCRSYGVNAKYTNKGKNALIRDLTDNNLIAPINIYHYGSSRRNRRGGHVVVAVDFDNKKGFLIYDPYGSRPPSYHNTSNGIYWMSLSEFNFRFQGLYTKYYGPI